MPLYRDADVILHLAGPVRLSARDGRDLTPRLLKAQAMLALLGTAKSLRRPRAWLQDHLWSDRQPEQGSASLRQALATLRQALGSQYGVVVTELGWIGLDPARVAVVLEPEAGAWSATGEPPEFCEGLDVPDPEFEDWIRDQRIAFERRWLSAGPPRVEPGGRGTGAALPEAGQAAERLPIARLAEQAREASAALVVVAPPRADDRALETLAEILGAQIASGILNTGGIDVRHEAPGAPSTSGDGLRLEVRLSRVGCWALLQASLVDLGSGSVLWTIVRRLGGSAAQDLDPDEISVLVAEVIAAAIYELGRGGRGEEGRSMRAAYGAIHKVVSYDSRALDWCEAILSSTDGLPGSGIRRAWRAHIRAVSVLERIAKAPETARDEGIEFIARALEESPHNPLVNAIGAGIALHLENRPLKALELARAAVRLDDASPFTHCSLAQALAWLRDTEPAHVAALQALRLSAGQPNQAWWNMHCCFTAIRSGRLEDAIRFARVATEIAAESRPPLRALAALLYQRHDEAGAAEALHRLKALEPDFSLEMMASDTYPVRSLREGGILGVTRSALI